MKNRQSTCEKSSVSYSDHPLDGSSRQAMQVRDDQIMILEITAVDYSTLRGVTFSL